MSGSVSKEPLPFLRSLRFILSISILIPVFYKKHNKTTSNRKPFRHNLRFCLKEVQCTSVHPYSSSMNTFCTF